MNLDTDGGANVGNAGTNTTNSEATRAQGDETGIEPDPEATEHDISTANESIDPNSESQLHVRKNFYFFKKLISSSCHLTENFDFCHLTENVFNFLDRRRGK